MSTVIHRTRDDIQTLHDIVVKSLCACFRVLKGSIPVCWESTKASMFKMQLDPKKTSLRQLQTSLQMTKGRNDQCSEYLTQFLSNVELLAVHDDSYCFTRDVHSRTCTITELFEHLRDGTAQHFKNNECQYLQPSSLDMYRRLNNIEACKLESEIGPELFLFLETTHREELLYLADSCRIEYILRLFDTGARKRKLNGQPKSQSSSTTNHAFVCLEPRIIGLCVEQFICLLDGDKSKTIEFIEHIVNGNTDYQWSSEVCTKLCQPFGTRSTESKKASLKSALLLIYDTMVAYIFDEENPPGDMNTTLPKGKLDILVDSILSKVVSNSGNYMQSPEYMNLRVPENITASVASMLFAQLEQQLFHAPFFLNVHDQFEDQSINWSFGFKNESAEDFIKDDHIPFELKLLWLVLHLRSGVVTHEREALIRKNIKLLQSKRQRHKNKSTYSEITWHIWSTIGNIKRAYGFVLDESNTEPLDETEKLFNMKYLVNQDQILGPCSLNHRVVRLFLFAHRYLDGQEMELHGTLFDTKGFRSMFGVRS